ncbi:glycosyltransferase family 1 protein [Priestia megaterium]|uniref:glycosyltransferase family 1 protein n=1 Tax=Priestia megaterium TaxID=1404 RepID=UPI0021D671DB|nr:glycosyltransferase family 1 protein [Priestia megaterium]MCU7740172.1 glycosyltransferase family 1 protein [Priestia megaterium]
MIRVLQVIGSMNRGGIETFLMNIYRNIDRNKVQFDFAVHTQKKCAYDDEILDLGGRIFRITPRGKNISRHNEDWNKLFKDHPEIQIVHQHVASLTYINGLKFAKKNKVKSRIIHAHNTQSEGKLHYLMHLINGKRIHKYVTDYFSCSLMASDWLYGRTKLDSRNAKIVNNAIDVKKFLFDNDKRRKAREELCLEGDFVIGHVGRLANQKNHLFLIDIFEKVSHRLGNAKLILVGQGPLKQSIADYINKKGLNDKVKFLGNRPDVNDIMQAMDVFVFPSFHEGLGIVLIEAQASGLKCFASKEGVPSEAKITDSLRFISLESPADIWADNIVETSYEKAVRDIDTDIIKEAGYEITNEALSLQNFYCETVMMKNK